jgi:hypothetical protein
LPILAILNATGLILNAAGVVLLFYFGMPYRIRTEGKTARTVYTGEREDLQKADRKYDLLGRAGLGLILAGTALQVYAIVKAALV